MILTILVSMMVYIFWFMKSEFQRVLDRVDQSTLGIARMQRELTQSTVQSLNEQINESFGRLSAEDDDEESDDEDREEDEEIEEVEDEEETEETEETEKGEKLKNGEGAEDPPLRDLETDRKEIEAAIAEIAEAEIEEIEVLEPPPAKKRGRKPKN